MTATTTDQLTGPYNPFLALTDHDLADIAWFTITEFQRRVDDDPRYSIGDRIDYQTAVDMLEELARRLNKED